MALPNSYGYNPKPRVVARAYALIRADLQAKGRAPTIRALAQRMDTSPARVAACINVLISEGKLVRGKFGAVCALGLPPTTHPSLDQQAKDWLADAPHGVIVWLQSRHGNGYYGFEVWTPDAGHIVTILET